MVIVSGDGQVGNPGQELAAPLVVRVDDERGQPVEGQIVNFRVTDGGGSVFAGAALTNQAREARERWTLGPEVGVLQRVEARAVDAASGAALVFASFQAEAQLPGSGVVLSTVSAAWYYHSCGLTPGGAAYCWGRNLGGALGNGTAEDVIKPIPQPVIGGHTFVRIAAGTGNACGLTAGGAAFCWNQQSQGVPLATGEGLVFTEIYVGVAHTCALTTIHQAYCWGINEYGQVGDGTTNSNTAPVAVLGGLTFDSLGLGSHFTCGLAPSGAVYCWGSNEYGTLGNGEAGPGLTALTPVPIGGGLTFKAITAGFRQACGLTSSGQAYCWGNNAYGELGDGSWDDSYLPTPVAGGLTFVAIKAGGNTCALREDGAPFCWGWNDSDIDSKQFTGGVSLQTNTPVVVPGGRVFTSLTVGQYHACGVQSGAGAYCWFYNGYGQLGDGTTNSTYTPTAVR